MKVILNIIKYIVLIILSISIILTIVLHIITSTLLNKNYILGKLEETNYYNNTYNQVEANFENYIYQSGLDLDVIRGIITEEDIKEDTKLIINNIYEGQNKKVDIEKIEKRLEEKIYDSLSDQRITESTKKSINQFIEKIVEEYKDTIIHTKYEQNIGKMIYTIVDYASKIKKILIIVDMIGIVILLLLNIQTIFRGVAQTGISLTVVGTFNIIVNIIINLNVKINYITFFNNGFSITLRNILSDTVKAFWNYGIILLLIGILLMILGNSIYCKKEENNE